MPVYERGPGIYRAVVWANGKSYERIVRGHRKHALAQEQEMRTRYGARQQLAADVAPADADETVWIGGHAGSYVYFVQAGKDGPIKIGVSGRTGLRLRDMQSGCPVRLRLLCVVPGGRLLERALHRAFDRQRLDGEWFKPTVDILALAAELGRSVSRETVVGTVAGTM